MGKNETATNGQSRDGGYRAWGTRMMSGTRSVREVPHAGLVMLKADGSNMTAWSTALNNHLIATYGQMANFITTGTLVKRTPPNAQSLAKTLGESADMKLDKLLFSSQQEFLKLLQQDAKDYGAIFGLIQQVVTDEGLERVTALEIYEEVREKADPLLLYHLVRRVHSLQMDRRSEEDAKYIAIQRYHAIRQLSGCSLMDYKAAFDMAVKPMPDLASQARHFMMNLDSSRYGEFIKCTLNDEAAGKGSFPKSVQSVVNGARAFIPVQRPMALATPTVYAKDVAVVCYRCQKPGPFARDCNQARRPKQDQSSDGKDPAPKAESHGG